MISIITVVKNNLEGLKRTHRSIDELFSDISIEWIVVDGLSTDGTGEYLRSITKENFVFLIESDRNMYDAMNKAILLSSRPYLLFLNAGDFMVAKFEEVKNRLLGDSDIVFFNLHKVSDTLIPVKWKLPDSFLSHLYKKPIVPHQSTLIHKRLFDEVGLYNVNYFYLGDYDFFCRLFSRREDLKISYNLDIFLSCFVLDGVSSDFRKSLKLRKELVKVQKNYYGKIYWPVSLIYLAKYFFSFLPGHDTFIAKTRTYFKI